jgi:hypothetical protein
MLKEYHVDLFRIAKLIPGRVIALEQDDAVCSLVRLLIAKEPRLNV